MITKQMRSAALALLGAAACGAPPEAEPADAAAEAAPRERLLAVEASAALLEARAAVYGLAGRGDLRLATVATDDLDITHARFQQTVHGIPVFGGEAIVHLARDQRSSTVSNGFIPRIELDAAPRLTADEALALARPGAATAPATPPDLWALRHAGRDHLVWRVQLRLAEGTNQISLPVLFLDAHDGAVVWQYDNLQTGSGPSLYSGTVSIDTISHSGLYYMEDNARKLGTFDMRNGGSSFPFDDADDTWDAPAQRAAIDAHLGALKTWEYFKNTHGRTGIDGTGGPLTQLSIDGVTRLITSRVHYSSGYNNAFWDGSQMTYGDGDGSQFSPLVALDVAGHEMMHGVTQHTANLVYANESGALNESYSDVFGAMVERYARGDSDAIWKIGDECYTPAIPGDALRHMDAPHLASNKGYTTDDDPDHYSERYTGGSDNGGVHINSGIANKAFYLLAMGGAHHLGGAMTGIGPDKAAAIWYRALTSYMTSSTTFVRAARATYDAAVALHGAAAPEATAVRDAWALVGLTVDLAPPEVAITAPAADATVIAPMVITAAATDNVGVTAVQFQIDGFTVATDPASPFSYAWNTGASGPGPHTLVAIAIDASGNAAASAPVAVTVQHETVPPTVAVTAPADGATVQDAVAISATAADNVAIARVELYVDGALLGPDVAPPYTLVWNTTAVANGPHALTAKAYDTVGNAATSAAITVTVANDVTPPSVAITAPASGAEVTDTIEITGDATDNAGVVRVELYADGILQGTDLAPPWQFAWSTYRLGNGDHTLVLRATDAHDNSASSAPVVVTAQNAGLATYDPVLLVPRCTAEANGCDTGGMIDGRDGRGPEPHAPNTLGGTCIDGTNGTYHASQSLDRLRVYTADGLPIATGKPLFVEATVWAASSSDALDLYYTTNPAAPSWALIASLAPGGTGVRTLTTSFTPPPGTQGAIRGQLRASGSASLACYPGALNDRDDLAFAVVDAPDTTPPTTALTAPAAGSELTSTVTLTATAADNIGVVAVELLVDGAPIATDTSPPYSVAWNTKTVPNGAHVLHSRARDAAGNLGTSAPIGITVHNLDTTPPATSITAPAAGATVTGTITVTASATDNVAIASVELYIDGVKAQTATAAPYSFAWDTYQKPNGTHTLRARAFDTSGNTTSSATISVVVSNADVTPPTTAITTPASGAILAGTKTVSATATDNVGVVAVELYIDDVKHATDTSSPYNVSWNTTTAGQGAHTLQTRALDAAGNAGLSLPVTVTVDNPDVSPPTAAIVAPAPGAILAGAITVTTAVADNRGVTSVELLLDNTVVATSTTAPFSIPLDTAIAANRTHTLRVRALDAAGNAGLSPSITVTFDNGIGLAAFDALLQAPACAVGYDGCDTGALILGRAGLGPEPHAPNTLHDACGDGGSGAFHAAESIDRLRVYTADGTTLAAGKTVIVEATLWNFWNLLESDVLDLYRTTSPDAASPAWVYLGSLTPGTAQGTRVVATSFALPAGAKQAIRANLRRKPLLGANTPSICTAGGFNDHDDLVFAVGGP